MVILLLRVLRRAQGLLWNGCTNHCSREKVVILPKSLSDRIPDNNTRECEDQDACQSDRCCDDNPCGMVGRCYRRKRCRVTCWKSTQHLCRVVSNAESLKAIPTTRRRLHLGTSTLSIFSWEDSSLNSCRFTRFAYTKCDRLPEGCSGAACGTVTRVPDSALHRVKLVLYVLQAGHRRPLTMCIVSHSSLTADKAPYSEHEYPAKARPPWGRSDATLIPKRCSAAQAKRGRRFVSEPS